MEGGETRLVEIVIDAAAPPATPEQEQEQRVALFELREEHRFDISGCSGAFTLTLSPGPESIRFTAAPQDSGQQIAVFDLHIGPFESMIRDYHAVCAAYFDAVRRLPLSRIEAIDEGRRAIHMTAGAQLVESLAEFATLDEATGRRLFSLISTLPR